MPKPPLSCENYSIVITSGFLTGLRYSGDRGECDLILTSVDHDGHVRFTRLMGAMRKRPSRDAWQFIALILKISRGHMSNDYAPKIGDHHVKHNSCSLFL
jgi:hypothetical protein